MRRIQDNFGYGSRIFAESYYTTGDWSMAVTPDTSRGATNTLQASAGGGAGLKTGSTYWEYSFGVGLMKNIQGTSIHNSYRFVDNTNGVYSCFVRFDFYWDAPNASNQHYIVQGLNGSAASKFYVQANMASSGAAHSFTVASPSTTATTAAVTDATWYRIEVGVQTSTRGDGYVRLIVYTIDTNTVVGEAQAAILASAAITDITYIRLGRPGGLFQTNAQTLKFANFALNDSQSIGSNVHGSWVGAGKAAALLTVTGDSSVQWASTGGSNYTEVDELGTPNDADYVNTATGVPGGDPRLWIDRYTLANYPKSGVLANDPRSIVVITRHKVNAGASDVWHEHGVHDGTQKVTYDLRGVGSSWSIDGGILSEQYGGGALTDTYYDGCDFYIAKRANLININDKMVSYVALEVEDDLGLAIPTPNPTLQRGSTQVV